jgi:PAS domain S-box-containing protein
MLLQQVNNLLDLARIDADKMPMVYGRIDVSTVVREVAANFDSAAGARSIAFSVEGANELYADVDKGKFERIVLNLLSNAFKFSPIGSRISCSLSHLANNRFLLSIQDSGPGVVEDMKEVIFGRFSQGPHTLSGGGSGLGLSIVKDFVELHEGTVAVLDAVGGGAIFQIELPTQAPDGAFIREEKKEVPLDTSFIEEVSNQHPSKISSPHPVVNGENKPRILIAEDNEDLRNFLCEVLEDDYQVIAVADGAAALSMTLANPPDLVLSDLMMPHFDGQHFIRELRSHPYLANVPIIVLSARVDDALREHLLADQVQDYLTKPFSPQELRVRIRNLVAMKRTVDILQRELHSQVSDVCELTTNLITSRKSLQDSLVAQKISERRWMGLYQNSAVGIALADREGRILAANQTLQKMLGYEEKDLLGVSLIEITKESHREMTQRNVSDLFDGSIKKYHLQKCYERQNGEQLWANVSVSLIPARENEDSRLAVVVEDISSRKEAESALAATQTELARVSRLTTMGELVASIAHEVNQPLSAIMTSSQAGLRWLVRESPDYHEVHEALKRVNQNASRAGEVISRIRNFLKIRATKREEVKVDVLLEDFSLMLHETLVDSGIRLERKIQPALPILLADPVQLQQVLLNLFLNAIDAMKSQTDHERILTVTVSVDPAGESFLFKVEDTGPGISPMVAEKIFNAFFSTKDEGMGMGLAISRSIVEFHGGRLWLAPSEIGASFLFNIPFEK